ncbi:NADH:flavin oxidoreductase [Pseudoalteromonas denitrificans]|uniref:2,4-dienoyl-CoA reductase n=1 Tax=Pseudoalteromonas denitrificans DSM 6059 TaxID=1123010 RepID=A0A1I1TS68_9GAMM|nr:NADH:flavin oxidoreductase [Pseudoalteromonas denitrificans]SFD60068.1 2,4-dienoyl-CoA reductase [Pseudoalteromonas denitrificans DSM 6059]
MMTYFATKSEFNFKKANKTTKNRAVLAPLTHNMSDKNGDLSEHEIAWLNKCAEGGFGMLITAATLVSPTGRSWQGQPSLLNKHQEKQFKQIAQVTKKHNTLAIVQLHHGGIRTEQKSSNCQPVAPSIIKKDQNNVNGARALSHIEIESLIDNFVAAAKRACHAGMSGVEIHAAFNFLLSNFTNPILNKRTDNWGGSFKSRAKILFEIVIKIRKQLPRDFIIGVRLSPENYAHFEGIDINEQIKLSNSLADLDIDYIHMSLHDAFKKPNHETQTSQTLLEWIKTRLNPDIPLIIAGKIATNKQANKVINLGADFVAIGKSAIGNPDWVNKINSGKSLIKAPYSQSHLAQIGFTKPSIKYLRSINGLVS